MDMDVIALPIEGIVSNPKIRGGKPIIEGRTLRVMDVAAKVRFHHYSPEQIAEAFTLTMAQVHAALAYYFAHQANIDADIDEEIEWVRQAKEQGLGQSRPPLSR